MVRSVIISAEAPDIPIEAPAYEPYKITVDVAKNGKTTINGKVVGNAVQILPDTDRLRLKLIDEPSVPIYASQTVVTLPLGTNPYSLKITPRLIHNYTAAVDQKITLPNTITLTTQEIAQSGKLSLEIDFPKGVLSLPITSKIAASFVNQTIGWWTAFALLLPLVSLGVLLALLSKRFIASNRRKTKNILESPPENLPPAIVEVLLYGRITAHSIAATLVDLARRGYIVIGAEEDSFRFAKHKPFMLPSDYIPSINTDQPMTHILQSVALIKDTTDINYFERLLLSKIFTPVENVADKEDLEFRIGHRLFSEKIAEMYKEVYRVATEKNYFIDNPAAYHRNYKNLGLAFFFASILGFIVGAKFFPEPKTTLFFWVGMLLTAVIIIKVSTRLPMLNDKGLEAFTNWYAFRNYLKDSSPIKGIANPAELFETYLPYAIALGVAKEWSARFRDFPFAIPNWFEGIEEHQTLETFNKELFPLIGWLANHLNVVHTPTVE